MVTSSLDSLSAFDVAWPDIRSLALVWDAMQPLHLLLPAMSGASQVRQQMENPICSMALRGIDIGCPRRPQT